jgi:5-methylcytosine-specific restriction enzyme B
VQFHQSYSYEDFVQGFRPRESGGFELKNGIFFDFVAEAQKSPEKKFFFVIDEINRGNLSRIFGELLMLIEPDKRGSEFGIPLTYSRSRKDRFFIPENVYVIGTMNTADRSLSLVDYALRRRFSFFDLRPVFTSEKFKDYLLKRGAKPKFANQFINRMEELNQRIAENSKSLGPGFMIGHSYFCRIMDKTVPDENWLKGIIESELYPLLREYWVDEEERAKEEANRLCA